MDIELRLARLQSELDAFRVRRDDEKALADARFADLEERVAAQAGALLVLTRAAASLSEEAQKAVPDALMRWASELREQGEERGAVAAESLAAALLRTLPSSQWQGGRTTEAVAR